jgi:Sulfotransferase domain
VPFRDKIQNHPVVSVLLPPQPEPHNGFLRIPITPRMPTQIVVGCDAELCTKFIMRKPNCFIVGGPRCGTTGLYSYLKTHPQICMSDFKEPNYFSDDLSPQLRQCTTEGSYLAIFSGLGEHHTVIGEATVFYLYSKMAIPNIKKFNPDAKLIAMFRDPAEVLYSVHSYFIYEFFIDKKDFMTAWNSQAALTQGNALANRHTELPFLHYRELASFGEQLQRAYTHFPPQQVKVIFYEDLSRDPGAVYAEVLNFLGVPHDGRTDFPVVNAIKRHRIDLLGRALHNMPVSLTRSARAVKKALGLKTLGVGRLARKVDADTRRPAAMPEEIRQTIIAELRPDIELLEKLTGRNLSRWKM